MSKNGGNKLSTCQFLSDTLGACADARLRKFIEMIDMFNQGLTISEIARRTENSRVFATTAAVELMAVVASGLGGARWPRLLSLLAEAFGIPRPARRRPTCMEAHGCSWLASPAPSSPGWLLPTRGRRAPASPPPGPAAAICGEAFEGGLVSRSASWRLGSGEVLESGGNCQLSGLHLLMTC